MAMKKTARIMLAVFAVSGMVYYVGYSYAQWRDRGQYLRWSSAKQQALRAVGERMRAYSEQHNDRLPQTLNGFVAAGVMAESEITFTDPSRDTKVTRSLRPVPGMNLEVELILMIETYDPPGDGLNILYSSGHVVLVSDLPRATAVDNKLRRENGLPELP